MKTVAERYGYFFLRVREEWRDLLEQVAAKGEAQPQALPDANAEALRQVLYAADSPVSVPTGAIVDQEWYFDEPTRVELFRLQRTIDATIIEQPGRRLLPSSWKIAPCSATRAYSNAAIPPRKATKCRANISWRCRVPIANPSRRAAVASNSPTPSPARIIL